MGWLQNFFLGKVPSGFPEVSPPAFSLQKDNVTLTFGEMVSELTTGVIFVPLISIVANIGIAKAFGNTIYFVCL